MGVPVVSADVGGQRDLVDETVGALIPCTQSESDDFDVRSFDGQEVDAYVRAVTELLTDHTRWENASRNCLDRIERSFTIVKMVDYFEKEFTRLIEEKNLRTSRIAVSQALGICSPIAAELFTTEMQMQTAEEIIPPQGASLFARAMTVLRTKGLCYFCKKCFKWIAQKMVSVLKH